MRTNLNDIKRCPWCWGFLTLAGLKNAIKELWIPKENLVIVWWIGCTSKTPQYINSYWAEALHWRTLPFAIWVKLANPDLTVIAVWWDWDWYWIWLGHFLHSCRRDINITYIVSDNENYALTTWQASATTPLNIVTKSTPQWNQIPPLDPVLLAKSAWCWFTIQMENYKPNELKEKIKEAILHPWFSHINVKQNCVAWKKW